MVSKKMRRRTRSESGLSARLVKVSLLYLKASLALHNWMKAPRLL